MNLKRSVHISRSYPYPPEVIWEALSDPTILARWFLANEFEPRVGHRFQFQDTPKPGFDGVIESEVTVVERPHRLAYTFTSSLLDTVVTFILKEQGEGTLLELDHRGFQGLKAVGLSFLLGSGWKSLLSKRLAAVLQNTDAEGATRGS